MKTLNAPKFIIYAIIKAVRHPRTPIEYFYCVSCKVRFPSSSDKCPKCGDSVKNSPDHKRESPVPWWAALLCIIIGVTSWIVSACFDISGLSEAARILVYAPLGHLFGMSIHR